ncbi:MAG: 2-hydroxy-3-oxopropionate reductase [Anaerolineales bacterium]|jgi:2-hydroxy-3-oxopropionate reductase
MKTDIGFIGLGIMGLPMAKNLLKAGYGVVGYDLAEERLSQLLAQGALSAASPRDVSARAQVVITMLPDSPDVEKVYLDDNGVLAGAKAGTLLIDMSTISPVTAVKVANEAGKRGCPMLDAPVSGGETGAIHSTLSIMVGGPVEIFKRGEPFLKVLGKPVLCGPSGAGQTVKACNQIQVALNLIGMAEALVLGQKAGVDPAIVLSVLSAGYAQTRVMDVRGPRVIRRDFTPGFRSRLHFKDLNIVRETARAFGCSLPASALAHELFSSMQAHGWGDLDHSAVIKVIELLSNGDVQSISAG